MSKESNSQQPVDQENSDWWSSFHVPEMADLFLVRDDAADLDATLHFLETRLDLSARSYVYDQCCGVGSLSIALAQRGMRVTGADLCDDYIQRGLRDVVTAGVDCHFETADAFLYIPPTPCDAVFNWYSSFGYADTDVRNRQMFERAFDALKPRGRFALDVPNLPGLLRNFQRYLVRRGNVAGRSITLIRESSINLHEGTLRQVWTWMREGEPSLERRSCLRLYLPHQIREMLEQSGFENIQFCGDLEGDPLTLESPRLLCVAEKSERSST